MDVERDNLRASKGQNALICDGIEQLFSDVSIVKKAPRDQVETNEQKWQAPEFEKPVWLAVRVGTAERKHPHGDIPKDSKPAPH